MYSIHLTNTVHNIDIARMHYSTRNGDGDTYLEHKVP